MKKYKLMICAALVLICSNSQSTKAQICTGSAITSMSRNAISTVTSISAISLPSIFDTECLTDSNNVLTDTESDIEVHVISTMYATSDVRIRSKKSRKSKIFDVLKCGKSITVLNYDSKLKWQEVEYKHGVGYIYTDYLSDQKPTIVDVDKIKLNGLSNLQKQRAYTIAKICIKEWKQYGVLPSIAIAQAMQESTLGKHCSGNNLWGIASGTVSYSSLEDGVYGYLKVINNGYYGTAPFTRNASNQISKILAGGYCTPVGNYYDDIMWIIDHYELERFDKLIK